MRGKHYAIGAAILTTIGAAALALVPESPYFADLARMADRPSQTEAPVIATPKAPPQFAQAPTRAPAAVIPPAADKPTASPLSERPVASITPSDTPFVWHGSGNRGQSWTGTGGRAVATNDTPATPSFTLPGSGGSSQNLPNLPSFDHGKPAASTSKAPATPKTPPQANGGDGNGEGEGEDNGTSPSPTIETASNNSNGGTSPPSGGGCQGNGPAKFPAYEAPDGGEQQTAAVTVDEPGALPILLVSTLGLLVARRVLTKRGAA